MSTAPASLAEVGARRMSRCDRCHRRKSPAGEPQSIRSRPMRLCLLALVLVACGGDDGSKYTVSVQPARRSRAACCRGRRWPTTTARTIAIPKTEAMPIEHRRHRDRSRRRSTAGTASRRPGRCSPRSRTASSADGLPPFKDPGRVARRRLADRRCSTSTPASARRSSPRSTRTRPTRPKRDADHPPARAPAPSSRTTRRDPQHGQGRRRQRRCRCRRRSRRCATARAFDHPRFAELAKRYADDLRRARDRRRRQVPTSCSRGTSTPRPTSSCTSDLTDDARRRAPRDGRRTAPTCRSPRRRSRPIARHLQRATSARSSRPTSSPTASTTTRSSSATATRQPDAAGPARRALRRDHPRRASTTQPLPRPTIIFGHGLFGSAKDYLDDAFVQSTRERRTASSSSPATSSA